MNGVVSSWRAVVVATVLVLLTLAGFGFGVVQILNPNLAAAQSAKDAPDVLGRLLVDSRAMFLMAGLQPSERVRRLGEPVRLNASTARQRSRAARTASTT